jgi:hypothetical protein
MQSVIQAWQRALDAFFGLADWLKARAILGTTPCDGGIEAEELDIPGFEAAVVPADFSEVAQAVEQVESASDAGLGNAFAALGAVALVGIQKQHRSRTPVRLRIL